MDIPVKPQLVKHYLDKEVKKMQEKAFNDEYIEFAVKIFEDLIFHSQNHNFIEYFDEVAYPYVLKTERLKAKI